MAHQKNDTPSMLEYGEVKAFDFSEETIRKAFVKKVYSILMVQLLITFSFITLFVYCEPVKLWAAEWGMSLVFLLVSMAVVIVSLIVMACCEAARRKSPVNIILLGIFTIGQSYMLGMTSCAYESDTVMLAVGITAAVCLALTLFAFQTKWDFTTMGGILVGALVILLLFGIIAWFVQDRIVQLVYAALGALLFSVYLVYDTQLMLGGEHKYSISPEEYIFAALNLYLDIINLLLYILRIIGGR